MIFDTSLKRPERYTASGIELILNKAEARVYGFEESAIEKAEEDPEGRLIQHGKPEAYLSKMLATNAMPVQTEPEYLNRAQRRAAERGNLPCRKCGIQYRNRFEEWSACTVNAPPVLVATGHRFL